MSNQKSSNGFLIHPEVGEEEYSLPKNAVEKNLEKLNDSCHPFTVVKGSEWGDGKAINRIPQRSKVKILG